MASRTKRPKPVRKPSVRKPSTRLRVEALEDRRLLSGTTDSTAIVPPPPGTLVSVAAVSAPTVVPPPQTLASVPAVVAGQTSSLVVVTVTPVTNAAASPKPTGEASQVFLASDSSPPVLVTSTSPSASPTGGGSRTESARSADARSNRVIASVAKTAWSIAVANNSTDLPNQFVFFGQNHREYLVDIAPLEAMLRGDHDSDSSAANAGKPAAAPADAMLVQALASHPHLDMNAAASAAAKAPEGVADAPAHADLLAEFFAQEARQAAAKPSGPAVQGMDLTAIDVSLNGAAAASEAAAVALAMPLRLDHAFDAKELAPALADLFTDLMPFDMGALELGARQILERIEDVSLAFTQPQNFAWWSAGAASMAATAVAMEISRRHLRITTPALGLASGGESKNGTWFPPDSSGF